MRPILHEIFDALQERGWKMATSGETVVFQDPDGNTWHHLEDAITAQTLREIEQA